MNLYEIHFVSGESRTIYADSFDAQPSKSEAMWVFMKDEKPILRIPISGTCYVIEANTPPWASG